MPSPDYPYRIQGQRVNRREVLRYAFVAGVGLVAIPLIGCGKDEEEARATSTAVATAVPPSGFFDSDGVKIHYETFGEGKPIILVHGFTANLKVNWTGPGWVEDIKPLRRVVALDCRGHGESDKPHDPEAYGNENMAGDVLNLMDYLGIEKADIFGYSMGSGITCYLLANHRERLTAAIMAAIGDRFVLEPADEVRSNDMAEAMLAEDPSQITDPVARNFRAIAEAIPGNDLEALAACAMRAREPVDAAALGAVDIPVLLLNGGKDEVMGTADELVAAIPRATQVIIADADHLVVFDPLAREPALSFLQSQKEEA
jgi:pimeloyl-ACP methyl ester carboxylesterase